MIIKKLILKGYKRLFLNNINLLEYTPDKSMQIILGRNMSGKSQTLRQLNPLPANLKNEFYENGYKYIEIEHLGNNYILSSGYVNANKHSFILNNVELNPGGTRKVQLDLIKDHFNITPDIIDILLNLNNFTNMSPAERKKWLSEMSNIDYTFSITVYNKLRNRHRDIIGSIKLTQEDIINSESNILKPDELEKFNKDKEVLDNFYRHVISLYEHQTNINTNIDNNELESLNNELKLLLNKDIQGNIKNINNELIISNAKLEVITKEYDNLIKEIDTFVNNIKQTKTLENKRKLLAEINKEIENLKPKNIYNLEIEKIISLYKLYQDVYPTLISNLNNLIEYDNIRKLNNEQQQESIIKFNRFKEQELILTNKIKLLTSDIEHINKHKNNDNLITCPECSYKFYNGYDENKVKDLIKQLESSKELLHKVTTLKQKYEVLVNKIEYVTKTIDNIKNIIRFSMDLKPIWIIFLKNIDFNISSIQDIISKLDSINVNLNNILKLPELIQEQKELFDTIQQQSALEKLNTDTIKQRIKELEDRLKIVTANKQELTANINILTNKKQVLERIDNLYKKIRFILKDNKKKIKNAVVNIRNQHLSELASIIKEEIIKIDQSILLYNQSSYKLNKDKELLTSYKEKEKVLNLMVRELSPTEGLIAKSINSFLNIFIQEMNKVINSIWTYDVELLPCEITEDNDLDYKFRVKVNNQEIIEDVSKLSSSLKEIMDLAFRIVFAKYMKLIEVPLYLDEFGATFDKAHRMIAYNVIDKILTSDYKQVFLICHYESLYGSLQNVDFNILDSNNIELDNISEFNKHLKIS